VFSHRDEFGQWDPKNQRPELWSLYNPRKRMGENLRVFPISNWTEMDVMDYAKREIDRASFDLLRPHAQGVHARRDVDGGEPLPRPMDGEEVVERVVRFRTVGDMSCTAAVESDAETLDDSHRRGGDQSDVERGASRADDRTSEAAMEDRKREGYF
jgi:sulfate adenylyltransferase subunit 2